MIFVQTPRLSLRQWQDSDRAPFAQMNACAQVMEYFPATYSQAESNMHLDKQIRAIEQRGYGFFAAERRDTREFIGFIGLSNCPAGLPFAPCVEIGWRLLSAHWGQGFATEGALACLEFAFTELDLPDVISMTPCLNKRSERVMQKLGLENQYDNFNHPSVPPGHALCEHVFYKIDQTQWREQRCSQSQYECGQ